MSTRRGFLRTLLGVAVVPVALASAALKSRLSRLYEVGRGRRFKTIQGALDQLWKDQGSVGSPVEFSRAYPNIGAWIGDGTCNREIDFSDYPPEVVAQYKDRKINPAYYQRGTIRV